MKQTLRTLGLVALVFAATSWLAERTFYNGVEITGVLQESFFLPLSFILGAVGVFCLAMSFLIRAKR